MTASPPSDRKPHQAQRRPVLGRRPFLGLLGAMVLPAVGTGAGLAASAAGASEGASVGYVLFDPDSGRMVEAQAADTGFIPASVAKLPTVAAALALLGPDHRFTTRLLATGTPGGGLAGGVLRGDLILQGGGDPALATEGLLQLLGGLAATGLRRVEGRFLYDTALLPELAEIDSGQPWAAPYNTGVGALSLNYNRALLSWRRGAGGTGGPEVLTVADAGRLPLDSVAVRSMAAGGFPLLPDGADRWLMAPPAAGEPGAAWVPVARPGLAAATLFRRLAGDAGIALPVPEAGRTPAGAATLAVLDSPPLTELARGLLRHSNNLSAEVIGLAASNRLEASRPETGRPDVYAPTLERSAALLQGWLTRQPMAGEGAGQGWSGLRLANHSGLGTGSRATPRQMAALLRGGGPALWDLLPGEEDGKALPPGVHAKSGTLAYVKGLAGLLTTAGGRRLGFVLFIADPARRAAMDAALDRRVTAAPAEARVWAVGAGKLQSQLLERWVSTY
ncbi:D-alanyl-D-alanine carboxypeptidase/D-alanyl-D-alanine-endopeptidase [Azospirillum endophyticum]